MLNGGPGLRVQDIIAQADYAAQYFNSVYEVCLGMCVGYRDHFLHYRTHFLHYPVWDLVRWATLAQRGERTKLQLDFAAPIGTVFSHCPSAQDHMK